MGSGRSATSAHTGAGEPVEMFDVDLRVSCFEHVGLYPGGRGSEGSRLVRSGNPVELLDEQAGINRERYASNQASVLRREKHQGSADVDHLGPRHR